MLREEAHPQTGLPDLDHGVLDAVDVDAAVHHDASHQSRDDLVADEDRHDRTGVADDAVSLRLEPPPQIVVVLSHLFPALRSFGVPQDVQLGQGSRCLSRVDGGGVAVGVSEVAQQLEDFGVFGPHEADVGAETFAASPAEQHVGEVSESLLFPGA